MPELPEVEITVRRLDAALAGGARGTPPGPRVEGVENLRPPPRGAGRPRPGAGPAGGRGGATVESALAPGMNVMKPFAPPLEALAGRELSAVRRIGKLPVVEFGDLALLIHLMSAGRLRWYEKRASLKDRASRVL